MAHVEPNPTSLSSPSGSQIAEGVRLVLKDYGRLSVDVETLSEQADLYQAGMTSHASVNLMLALEDHFDVEFPDHMLETQRVRERRLDQRGRRNVKIGVVAVGIAAQQDLAFLEDIRRIADEVAATHADDVDRNARFPHESLEALKEARALSAFVPAELGGGGLPFETIAAASFELGRRCGATAMVFAMHQIQVACSDPPLDGAPWFDKYLSRPVGRATADRVGDLGSRDGRGHRALGRSGVHGDDGTCTFEKKATTVSYGAHADDLLTTVRRRTRRRRRTTRSSS